MQHICNYHSNLHKGSIPALVGLNWLPQDPCICYNMLYPKWPDFGLSVRTDIGLRFLGGVPSALQL